MRCETLWIQYAHATSELQGDGSWKECGQHNSLLQLQAEGRPCNQETYALTAAALHLLPLCAFLVLFWAVCSTSSSLLQELWPDTLQHTPLLLVQPQEQLLLQKLRLLRPGTCKAGTAEHLHKHNTTQPRTTCCSFSPYWQVQNFLQCPSLVTLSAVCRLPNGSGQRCLAAHDATAFQTACLIDIAAFGSTTTAPHLSALQRLQQLPDTCQPC